jgi:hypothetical protein
MKLKNGCCVDGVKSVTERATLTTWVQSGIMQGTTWVGSPGMVLKTIQNA